MAPRRKKSATVNLQVRMKEPLRARLERAAKGNGLSINAEVNRRLDESFAKDDADDRVRQALYEQFGGIDLFEDARWMARALQLVEFMSGGEEWHKSKETAAKAMGAVKAVLHRRSHHLVEEETEELKAHELKGITWMAALIREWEKRERELHPWLETAEAQLRDHYKRAESRRRKGD